MMLEKENLESAAGLVEEFLKTGKSISNIELIEICQNQGLESIAGEYDSHIAHEILEVAINNYVSKKYFQKCARRTLTDSEILTELRNLEKRIPTQSWRSIEQQQLQQFSTPPTVGFLMAYILKPLETDLVLEPSAGTGALAAWLKTFACRIQLNELSERRRILLEIQGYAPTKVNAEFLDDLLPDGIKPDGVLMNPPFSSSAGRTKANDSNFGFRHLRSALSRLKNGGRLVALLGTEAAANTDKGRKFWNEIATADELMAFIHLPKGAFYKYGTSIKTSIVCLRKGRPTSGESWSEKRKNVLEVNCETLEDCLKYGGVFE